MCLPLRLVSNGPPFLPSRLAANSRCSSSVPPAHFPFSLPTFASSVLGISRSSLMTFFRRDVIFARGVLHTPHADLTTNPSANRLPSCIALSACLQRWAYRFSHPGPSFDLRVAPPCLIVPCPSFFPISLLHVRSSLLGPSLPRLIMC